MLLLIVLSHRYIQNYLKESIIDILRGVCMWFCALIIAMTMSPAI